MAGIYIHIPFCTQACHYCDFHFSTNLKSRHEIVQAIAKEIALQKNYLRKTEVHTIYFGGGTPSLLTEGELGLLLETIHTYFKVQPDSEITLEANPDDLPIEKLNELKKNGINRLSIGIQSFDDKVLEFLHRTHNAEVARMCIREAREAGFSNISIDLIFGIPDQNDENWMATLNEALTLHPEHLSAYALTIEEKTVFGRWSAQGKFRATAEDNVAKHMELLMDKLEQNGYEQYEISNFSKPGFLSRHNSNYWKQEPYLGVGPSAHSFDGQNRQHNVSSNPLYLKALIEGSVPFQKEELSLTDRINDYILTSLRTSWGCDTKKLLDEFQFDLVAGSNPYIDRLVTNKMATFDNSVLTLTRHGKLLADKIASDLFT